MNIAADGDSLVVDDTLFTVCPWWDGPVVRERLAAQLEADARRRQGLRWAWIHHAPPRNSPTSWSGSRSMGDVDLETWINQHNPDIVVSGHIHQSPFVKDGSWADRIGTTWVFNSGHQFGVPPAYVVLETTASEAVWISAKGVQTVRLDTPLQRPIPAARAMPEWFGAGASTAKSRARDTGTPSGTGSLDRADAVFAPECFKPDQDHDRTKGGNPVPAGGKEFPAPRPPSPDDRRARRTGVSGPRDRSSRR